MSSTRDTRVAGMKDLDAYEGVARVAGAFADPVRLEIVEALAQSPRSVEALAEVCGLPQKNISYHLQKLRSSGAVTRIPLGRRAVYSLTDDAVSRVWTVLREFATGHLPGSGGAGDRDLTREELERLVEDRAVTLIDVRPSSEYEFGHLPGAVSVPLETLESAISDLPRRVPVVAYCRGPYCKMAAKAVDRLEEAGFEAARFSDGVVEWKGAGRSVVAPDGEGEPEAG